jgi:hypothetical protein
MASATSSTPFAHLQRELRTNFFLSSGEARARCARIRARAFGRKVGARACDAADATDAVELRADARHTSPFRIFAAAARAVRASAQRALLQEKTMN